MQSKTLNRKEKQIKRASFQCQNLAARVKIRLSGIRMNELVVLLLLMFSPAGTEALTNEPCVYIGCHCNQNQIKCTNNLTTNKFVMFPKRSLIDEAALVNMNVSFDLSENNVKFIPDDRFAGLKMRVANLSSNHINTLSPDAFRDVQTLQIVDLSNNFVFHLDASTFIPVESLLVTLILESNYLAQMDPERLSGTLSRLHRLEHLNLARNQLVYMPDLTLLKNLKIVYFESNQIVSLIEPDTSEPLLPQSLIELHLQSNKLRQINKNSFKRLVNLKYLNLAFNQIAEISELSFVHLRELTELNLRNNHLKHIPSRIFYSLVRLDRLDLSSQKARLELINDYAFDRASNEHAIGLVDLSNNHIFKIESQAFCSSSGNFHVSIKEIDLRENDLKQFDYCVMRQLVNSTRKPVVKTSLAFNELYTNDLVECDCHLELTARLVQLEGQCVTLDGQIHASIEYDCKDALLRSQLARACSNLVDYKCLPQHKSSRQLAATTTASLASTVEATTNGQFNSSLLINETMVLGLFLNLNDSIHALNRAGRVHSSLDWFHYSYWTICFVLYKIYSAQTLLA